MSDVLSRVGAGRSSRAVLDADTPLPRTLLTPEFLITTYPRVQMEFNSRLLKLNDDADIMEELKGLTPEQLKALIALVKNV